MQAYQIDIQGNITELEEEPQGPSQERIIDIIHDSLNQNGYTFTWESPMPGQSHRQPLHGIIRNEESSIDLLI